MKSPRPSSAPRCRCLSILLACAVLPACVSLDTAAPPVEPGPSGQLAEGRAIYVGQCAKCHAVEAVLQYSAAEWATIMPDMVERTKLNAAGSAAVTAYVERVLRNAAR